MMAEQQKKKSAGAYEQAPAQAGTYCYFLQ